MDTRLPPVADERRDDLHDSLGRQQAPEGLGNRTGESGTVACLDRGDIGLGAAANECGALGCVRPESPPVDEISPLARRCYTMSESHLSGYRLILGFETLEDVQAAHEFLIKRVPHNVEVSR